MTKRCIKVLMAFVLLGSVSSCGSKGASAQAGLNTIDAVMLQATYAGADEFAPVELRLAREKQRLARAAMKAKKYTKAQMLGREAKVDAQFAVALATVVKSRHALEGLYRETLFASGAPIQETSVSQTDPLRALIDGE
jgi:hypothetical protein